MRSEKLGETTKQILAAPEKALYLWPYQNSIFYVRNLAAAHGRRDLEFKSVHQVLEPTRVGKYASRRELYIVLDHACTGVMLGQHFAVLEELSRRFGFPGHAIKK